MKSLALQMEGVSKHFPGMLAVDNVSLDIRVGEVYALMGENGAGKSTLMKTLTGSFNDYTGAIRIGGKEVTLHSPAAAIAHGIGMVYQELSLARPVSIAENLFAGNLPVNRWGMVDRKTLMQNARKCLSYVSLDVDPAKTVEEISPHEAQLVEIAKVLAKKPCILILDEPTSSLSRNEVNRLFEIIRELKRRGLSIVYISHHLPEVFEIADRVTVLRDGRNVGVHELHAMTPDALVKLMVGQSINEYYHHRQASVGETVLQVNRLTRYGFFHDISFHLRRGEILGLVGLCGAGRTELARSLCGLDPVHCGEVRLHDKPLALNDYPRAVRRGLVYLSEDRKADGLFLRLSLQQNLLAALLPAHSRFGLYRSGKDASITEQYLRELGIVAASPESDVGTLSGGNQQKVLLGKWLATHPRVLILDEPTRGVDVKAKQRIHDAVLALAERGTAILLITSDLPELVRLSDRALVLRNGRITGEMDQRSLTEESALLAANGQEVCAHA